MKIIENIRVIQTPPVAPAAPPFVVEPPHSWKVKRSEVNGGSIETARHQVIAKANSKLETIARVNPPAAGAIAEIASLVESKSLEWFTKIDEDYPN